MTVSFKRKKILISFECISDDICDATSFDLLLGTNPLDIDISTFLDGLSLQSLKEIFQQEQVGPLFLLF